MITTRRSSTWAVCLIGLFLLSSASGAAREIRGSLSSLSQERVSEAVLRQRLRVVPQLNRLNFGLGRFDGINFYFKKSLDKIFFQDRTIDAEVIEIAFDGTKISLHLFHPVLGDGSIQFVFDDDLLGRASDEDLQKILLTTIGDENNRYVFGDPDTRRYHLYTCIHTKEIDKLIRMTREEAERLGYLQCGFCFKKMVYLPDLALEMQIEKNWSNRLGSFEALVDDSEKQIYLKKVGENLLQNWPLQRLGYDYSFLLIKSERMDAIAIPTGKIVISTALMAGLENEEELEALLLLAIAHIEKRHSLKQFYLKLDDTKDSENMKNLAQAAGSIASVFPGGSILNTIGIIPFQESTGVNAQRVGFENDFKKEADSLAALYFDIHGKDKGNLISLIKKMQITELAQDLRPGFGADTEDFDFNDRINRVKNIQFQYFSTARSFVFSDNVRLPVQLDLIYQSILGQENKLVVYLSDKTILPGDYKTDGNKSVSLLIQDRHGKQEFKLLKKFTTEDLWGVQLIFEASGRNDTGFIQAIEKIELKSMISLPPTETAGGPEVEYVKFVKGKLEY